MNAKHEIRGLRKSFRYAAAGFLYCVNNERNMRIHLSALVLFSVFAWFYGLNRIEFMIYGIVCSLVIFAEMVNTSIEAVVDLASPSYHRLAKIAKDVAAGAVLVTAAAAVLAGLLLFGNPGRLSACILMLLHTPWKLVLLLALLLLALIFIFRGGGCVSKAAALLRKKK